jgi:hypothetical protein
MDDDAIEMMRKANIPLTRENYLNLEYFGDVPEELNEDEIPEMFRLPQNTANER